ncbi:MAG: RnfABCDGE type electron transport complex subunit B [Bacteroidetes bacterium]|nr:RnfABCDGE type electron transport complex subunit B [Bacteroidota bacterium]MBL6962933.1 RnfABCDGE type electron transport complex subunit B [Bacteroidota bacterium]
MILYAVISLGAIGVIAAIILFFVAQKFKVIEDPRIDEVEEVLPAANCGGCGFAGCRNFAEEIVKAENMEGFNCPVGGADLMTDIGQALGLEADLKDPEIAVLRCNGSCEHSPQKVQYDGVKSCFVANALFSGEGGCAYGCLGCGDCVEACDFDAMYMDEQTGLPVVKDNCNACGACVKACPRNILELRPRGKKDRRIFVACMNEEKAIPAKANCSVTCTACRKCEKVCKFDAIKIENFLAYIDPHKCTLCRKCAPECETNTIWEVNFRPRKERPAVKEQTVPDKIAEKPDSANPLTKKDEKSDTAVKDASSESKGEAKTDKQV